MKRPGQQRRELLIAMCPKGKNIVDVGADHGHVAAALGAIATERLPHRSGRRDIPWVIADGLKPFRNVEVAIIAGMGARKIMAILDAGPRPQAVVLHAQDDPPLLRRYLASHGWRIEREGLAPEAGRYAEVMVAMPGIETTSGTRLALGPRLLEGDDRYLLLHLNQLLGYWSNLQKHTRAKNLNKYILATQFVHQLLFELNRIRARAKQAL
jgi:tRNA A22 N-methylase